MLRFMSLILMSAIALHAVSAKGFPLSQSERQSTPIAAAETPFSDEGYAMLLRTYVNAKGFVNYPALQANPKPLKDYVTKLGMLSPSVYTAWDKPKKIAFLINAYNAITLESIIDQNPLKGSIKDIWGVWNLNKHKVIGQSVTLDTLEHGMLRKEFQEPRIHAALVCAAISCPPLRQEPYSGEKLNEQLADQVRKWLTSHGLRIDRAQKRVSVSSIFKWFGEDWQKGYSANNQFVGNDKERAVLNFISRYVTAEDKEYLLQGKYRLDYLNYDWSLNRQ